jgi:hypothetical protein
LNHDPDGDSDGVQIIVYQPAGMALTPTIDYCPQPYQPVGLPPFEFSRSNANQAALAQAVDQINGQFVLLTIGHSITLEISRSAERDWLPMVTDRNPQLVMVSGAGAGVNADSWANPQHPQWQTVLDRLTHAGVTPEQVEVVWLKTALNDTKQDYNARLLGYMEQILVNIRLHYPNIKVVYVSPHVRRFTFDAQVASGEPEGYWSGAAVQEFVNRHEGDAAPAVTYGPYLWSDDSAVWEAVDYQPDCLHLSAAGESKAGKMVIDWFAGDPTAVQWFLQHP